MTVSSGVAAQPGARDTAPSSAVAAVLWLWDTMQLEIGEVVAITDGHPWARLAALAATWYGTRPIFVTRAAEVTLPGVRTLTWTGADDDTRQLAAMLKGAGGVAVAELSGEAGLVDLVFEAVPQNSRVMLAGPATDRLTIDFYRNVHVKGLRLVSGTLEAGSQSPARADRVARLLSQPAFALACNAALAPVSAK